MKAEIRFDQARNLTHLELEGGIRKGLDHLARREFSERAAARASSGLVRILARELGKVSALARFGQTFFGALLGFFFAARDGRGGRAWNPCIARENGWP